MMSNKLYVLICTLTSAIAAGAIGLVTYFAPEAATPINSSISIAEGAIIAIVGNFANKQPELPR